MDFDFQPVAEPRQQSRRGYGAILNLDNDPLWSPAEEGRYTVRILPPNSGKCVGYSVPFALHWGIGDEKLITTCPREMSKGECAACEAFFAAKHQKNDALMKHYRPQKSRLVRILDRTDGDAVPRLWRMPLKQVFGQLEERLEGRRPDHPTEGFDFTFRRKGKGLNTEYTLGNFKDPSPISTDDAEMERILEHITQTPLRDLIRHTDPRDIARTCGVGGSDDDPEF